MPWKWKTRDNEVRIYNNDGVSMLHFSTEDLPSIVRQLTMCMQVNEERMKMIEKLQADNKRIWNEALDLAAHIVEESAYDVNLAHRIRNLKETS